MPITRLSQFVALSLSSSNIIALLRIHTSHKILNQVPTKPQADLFSSNLKVLKVHNEVLLSACSYT